MSAIPERHGRIERLEHEAPARSPRAVEFARQAYLVLYLGFIALPIIAGADKFFDLLGPWDEYLAPVFPRLLGIGAHTFMMAVGAIEIVAGLIVALKPKVGSVIVGLWLCGIIVNLLILGRFFDVALRDLGLALGALALFRLSCAFDRT